MSFIKEIRGDYIDNSAVTDVIRYCAKDGAEIKGRGVFLDSIDTIVQGFIDIKRLFHKTEGKQLHHLVISIYKFEIIKDKKKINITKESQRICSELISNEVIDLIYKLGYQCCSFIHNDTNTLHIHIVINSVSYIDGRKLSNMKELMKIVLNYLKIDYFFLDWEDCLYYD